MSEATTRPWRCSQTNCPTGVHDTVTAYRMGCRSGAATEARRLYVKRWREGRNLPRTTDDYIGIVRRIEAAAYMGWSQRAMEVETGTSARTFWALKAGQQGYVTTALRDQLVPSLERLAMTPRANSRVRNWARQQGFRPLMAWDDIDDPNERPVTEAPAEEVDDSETRVDAALSGRLSFAELTDDEQADLVLRLWRDLQDRGYGKSSPFGEIGPEIADRLGTDQLTVERIRERVNSRRRRQAFRDRKKAS